MFALRPATRQTRAGGFCGRGVGAGWEIIFCSLLLQLQPCVGCFVKVTGPEQHQGASSRARQAAVVAEIRDHLRVCCTAAIGSGPSLLSGEITRVYLQQPRKMAVSSESAARSAMQSNRVSMWKALIINSTSHPDKAPGKDQSRPYPSWADVTPLAAQPRLQARGSC